MESTDKLIEDITRNILQSDIAINMSNEDISELKNTLYINLSRLNDYSIEKKETSIVPYEDENMNVLKSFCSTKLVEGKSPSTVSRYYDMLKSMLLFLNKKYSDITTVDLRVYLAQYKATRHVSDTTLDGMRRIISSFFSWLQEEEYIQSSPARRLKKIHCEKKVRTILSDEELEILKMSCIVERDIALIELLTATGIRVSECSQLNISDVNFDAREIIVHGKGNKQRKVYFNGRTLVHLKKYLEERTDDNEALFVSLRTNRDGTKDRMTKQSIEVRLKVLAKSCGVENVHPHRFRRTCATNLTDRGMPLQDVSELLGHSQLETTKIYVCSSEGKIKQSYDKYGR